MRKRDLASLTFGAFLGLSSHAVADGYDPLALDHFVHANLALAETKDKVAADTPLTRSETLLLAQQGLQFDAEGYLISPDGQRLQPEIRVRW